MRPARLLPLAAPFALCGLLAAAPVVPALRGGRPGADPRMGVLGAEASRARAQARTAGERLQALNTREAALAARIGRNRSELIRLLGALERWRSDPPPALLVSPARAIDAARGALLMRAIAPALEARARTLAGQARALNGVRRQAAEADAAVFAAESAAADADASADAIAAHRAALEAPLLTPQERAARAQAIADPSLGGGLPAALAAAAPPPERLVAPVSDPPALGWGEAWPGRGEALGVVWRTPGAQAVKSPADGVVEYAGPLRNFRLVVILRLAGDWRLVLAGLQQADVGVGARVVAGRPIGRTPPGPGELYLQLRDGARAVDPSAALRLTAASSRRATPGGAAR